MGSQRSQTRGWMQDGSLEAPSGRCCRSSGRGMWPGVPEAGLAGVPVALPWHGRSCQLSLCLPAVGRKKLPAWTTGWDVLGCPWNAGQPSGHLVRGHPASGKERLPFAGLGQRMIFTRKEPRPGRPGAYAHPASQRHRLALGRPSVRQESISATAQAKSSSPGPPRAPQRGEGASGSSGWPGAWAGGRFQRGHCLPPSLARPSWASVQARRPHFQSGCPSFLPPAAGCLCLPGAAQNGRCSPPPFCV